MRDEQEERAHGRFLKALQQRVDRTLFHVVGGIERDVPLQKVFKGCMPFVLALVIATALCIAFPKICTFLPDLVRY